MCEISVFGWVVCCCSKLTYSSVAPNEMAETVENAGESGNIEQKDGILLDRGLQILVRVLNFLIALEILKLSLFKSVAFRLMNGKRNLVFNRYKI